MTKRIFAAIALVCLIAMPLAGCYEMGKATGSAVKGVEQSGDNFQKGYDKGHTDKE